MIRCYKSLYSPTLYMSLFGGLKRLGEVFCWSPPNISAKRRNVGFDFPEWSSFWRLLTLKISPLKIFYWNKVCVTSFGSKQRHNIQMPTLQLPKIYKFAVYWIQFIDKKDGFSELFHIYLLFFSLYYKFLLDKLRKETLYPFH